MIVGHNDSDWLLDCFRSLLDQVPAADIFFVDNASRDDSVKLVRRLFPEVKVIHNSLNRGWAGGNNDAIRRILKIRSYRYVLLLNPDTIASRSLVAELRRFLEENPEFGVVGPIQIKYGEGECLGQLNRVSRRDVVSGHFHIMRRWLPEIEIEVNTHGRLPHSALPVYYVQGSAFFARLEVFQTVGYFDEVFHIFFEEVDFCRRASWRGYRLALLKSSTVQHESRGPGNRSPYRLYYRQRNRYLFLMTDPVFSVKEIRRLTFKLLITDIRQLFVPMTNDFSASAFFRSLGWLVSHWATIAEGRRWRSRQYEQRQS